MKPVQLKARKRHKPFIPPPPLIVTFKATLHGRTLRLGKCLSLVVEPNAKIAK